MSNGPFKYFFYKFTDWLFRPKKIERILIISSFSVILALIAPSLISNIFQMAVGKIPVDYQNLIKEITGNNKEIIYFFIFLIIISLLSLLFKFIDERISNTKKSVIVIEGRGLRDDNGSSLIDAIPKTIKGVRNSVLLDLRKNMDGKAIEPEKAITKIEASHTLVNQQRNSHDRSNLTTIYGGLTSVPYTFLTGVLIDDEGTVVTYDWDRNSESWRGLNEEDDGLEFELKGIDEIGTSEEVLIALTFSYPVDDSDLESTFSLPIVRLTLKKMSSDSHWSEEKQNRLAQQFFEIVKKISSAGVKRIHLVMAAPNSVVFNFGRRYDKRNLPEIIVYQFERGQRPAYPWGINMPVSGVEKSQVIYNK